MKLNYRTIVLNGYFDENDRQFLTEYFVREFKTAEKENYTHNVFFNGCLNVLNEFNEQIDKMIHNRKNDIYFIVSDLKSKIEKERDQEEKFSLTSSLYNVQKELIDLLKNENKVGLTCPVQLNTHPEHSKQFNTEIVEFIEESIREAYSQMSDGNKEEVLIDLSDSNAKEKVIMLHKLGIFDFLRGQEPFNLSKNLLASALSGITGVDLRTIQSYINPIGNPSVGQKNNPLKNEKNVKKVSQTLINLGFNPSK